LCFLAAGIRTLPDLGLGAAYTPLAAPTLTTGSGAWYSLPEHEFDRSISFGVAVPMPVSQRRVRVDPRLCEGHALCTELAAEVFELSDDDVATCDPQPADALWHKVKAAVNACPRGAITIESAQHTTAQDRTERTATA
jgi:ferredoxin